MIITRVLSEQISFSEANTTQVMTQSMVSNQAIAAEGSWPVSGRDDVSRNAVTE